MVNKLLILPLLLITFVACNGTKIDFTEPKVENIQFVTDGEGITEPTSMSGTLIRPIYNDATDKISMNGKIYQVGLSSSVSAWKFILEQELNSQIPVRVTGKTSRATGYPPDKTKTIDVITIETILPQ